MIVVEEHTKEFAAEEMRALRASGLRFEVVPTQKIFDPAPDLYKYDEPVFLRCSVQTMEKCMYIYSAEKLLLPDSDNASTWYALPRDARWQKYMQRDMEHIRIRRDADGEYEAPGLKEALKRHFNKKVFLKSDGKSDLSARTYQSVDEAYMKVMETLAFGCHRTPMGLIVSDPISIDKADTEFHKAEYRLFVISGSVATASLCTDHIEKNNVPRTVYQFGDAFALDYRKDLPTAYTLDVALCNGAPVVVELNEIQASGLFAGHDMKIFYKRIKHLLAATQPTKEDNK